MAEPSLHLHRLVLRNPLDLQRAARDRGLPDHPYDPDYIFHSLLTELVGPGHLPTFVPDPRSPGKAVLAYSSLDHDGLREQAKIVAPPEVFALVDWEASQGKPLPAAWPVGKRIGFRTRVSPVVRGPKGHGRGGAEIKKSRPEVDAYLARCWQREEPLDREVVYREWLDRELARNGAAKAIEMRMAGFRLKRALRRDGARKARAITRPDALFKGALRIEDPEAFRALLARGLGRHRGFGFGMLLLTTEGS
ncbi:MAG: hypothetical protein Kow0073_14320 [Immundisolibacter sp.]